MPTDTDTTAPAGTLQQITNYLAARGLTPAQIAGVEGNLQQESGFSTTAYNAKEGAIGLAQWEGGRRTALEAYAAAHGTAATDLGTQLQFMWHELTGPESGALTQLKAATTPQQAAAVFDQYYERSSGSTRTARINNAVNIFAGGDAKPNGAAPPASVGAESPYDRGTLAGQIFDAISTPVLRFAMMAVFVAGGIALVIGGLVKAVQPTAAKAIHAAETVARTIPAA